MAEQVGEVYLKIGAVMDAFNRAIDEANAKATGLGKKFDEASAQIERTAQKVTDVGKKISLTLSLPLAAIGAVAVKNAAAFEQQEIAFTTMLGSAEKAKILLQQITEFSASTPFQLPEITEAGKKLLAFGESAENVVPVLRRIGDVAAGLGVGISELSEIYGKARVQGTLYAEDMNQLAGRGIPIFSELAKIMGVSASQIKKMASEGKIQFKDLEKVFVNLTSTGGMFAGMMDKQSESFSGLLSTMKDNLSILGREVASVFLPALKDIVSGITEWVKKLGELSPETKKFLATMLLIGAALGPMVIVVGKLISVWNALSLVMAAAKMGFVGQALATGASTVALIAHKAAAIAATIASKGLFAVLASNPVGLVLTAVVGLGIALISLVGTQKDYIAQTEKEVNLHREKSEKVDKLLVQYDKLEKVQRNNAKAQAELADTVLQLNKLYPEVAIKFDEHGKIVGIDTEKIRENQKAAQEAAEQKLRDALSVAESDKKYYDEKKKQAEDELNTFIANERAKAEQRARMNGLSEEEVKAIGDKEEQEIRLNSKAGERAKTYTEGFDESAKAVIRLTNELNKLLNKENQVTEVEKERQKIDEEQRKKSFDRYKSFMSQWQVKARELGKTEIEIEKQKRDEALRTAKVYEDAELKYVKGEEKKAEVSKKFAQIRAAINDEYEKKAFKSLTDNIANYIDQFRNMFSALNDIIGGVFAYQKQAIEEKYSKLTEEEEAYNAYLAEKELEEYSKMTAKEKKEYDLQKKAAEARAKLEEKKEKELAKIERRQAIAQRIGSLFSIAADTAKGIMSAMAKFWYTGGLPWVPIIAGTGAAQAAAVLAQPLPKAAKGGYSDEPAIFGEAGPELAIPLSGPHGRAALREMTDALLLSAEDRNKSTTVVNQTGDVLVHNIVNLGSNVLYDDITRASDNGEIRINPRSVR